MANATPIVTLTLNPALDISSSVPVVTPSDKLRCGPPTAEPGGGGINVTRVCRRLGEPSVAVLPAGGHTGTRVTQLLGTEGIDASVVPIAGETRQSISIWEETTDQQYRFVLPGAALDRQEVSACLATVTAVAANARCVVVSGSMPSGVPPDLIEQLVAMLPNQLVLVDTSGEALSRAITSSGAHLVKPSARELANAVGRTLDDEADIEAAATEVYESGSVAVLVASIGAGGALLVDERGVRRFRAPTVRVRSAVGAGDSMVAGIAVGLQRGLDADQAVALGVAAGTAAVLTDGTALCRANDVERLLGAVIAS